MATSLGHLSYINQGRRPSRIDAPPTRGEVKKLRDRLITYARDESRPLTEEACEFISNAVVSPQYVRAQCNRPTIRPTATGHLEVVYATVPVDCLVPDPGNGRVVGATSWPAADESPGQTLKLWTPADLHVHPRSNCEAMAMADTVKDMKRVVEEAADRTKQLNPKMKSKIERDGILDPLLCQLLHVQTNDGYSGIALVTRDGSTRCSFAKEAHRAVAHDALFGPVRDLEVRRERWLEMKRRFEGPAGDLTEEELIQLRTFLVDVQIILGHVSYDQNVSVLDAVDDIVRRTHVEVSHPWIQVAQDNNEADRVLVSLRNHEVITRDQFLLYGGKLSRSERIERELPGEPDEVLAEMLIAFGANASRTQLDGLHSVIRRATAWGNVRNTMKATIVGSLALRQFPFEGRSIQVANTTLIEALRLDSIWEEAWENTTRSPAELRDAALVELAADGAPGSACRELLIKGAGHLACEGWLRPQIAGGRGLERDQRQPNVFLDVMHRTPQGIEVLAEALEAGRRGAEARALSEEGRVLERGGGDPMPLSNEWIRNTFGDALVPAAAGETTKATAPLTPREEIAACMRKVDSATTNARQAVIAAAAVKDADDVGYLDRYGWSRGEIDPIVHELRALAQQLETFGLRGDLAQNLPPLQPTQLELDEIEEAAAA